MSVDRHATGPRRYGLLCPIARALDHIGDRWTLLVLRDLHAGPARFSDIQAGLPGLASNLLTDRLRRLETDDLVQRRVAEFGANVYELTPRGESTGELLYALARLGTQFPADKDPTRPGNLRTIAVTLKEALRGTVDSTTSLRAGLIVDDEAFEVTIISGEVEVTYREPADADVTIATSYEPLMSVTDGGLSPERFTKNHIKVVAGDSAALAHYLDVLNRAIEDISSSSIQGAH